MKQHLNSIRYTAFVSTAALALWCGSTLSAEQLRYDSARDWRQWELPLGAVDLTALGVIQPTRIERLTDAVRDLDAFDGGIRNAGSNLNLARFAIDGDPTTGWAPDPESSPENWFLEVDLGRAVSAHSAANFTEPLAARVLGEIFPQQAQSGVPTEFTYYLKPENTSGFDRLAVESVASVHFMSVSRNGTDLDVRMDTTANGFLIHLPNRIRIDQLIELKFESSVFRQSTRFDVFLQDSNQDDSVRQRVDPGDASELIESNTNVVSLPVSPNLFANVALSSPVSTPNGDGVNDALQLSVDLINVLEPRPLRLRLYDLAGRPVYDRGENGRAGQHQFSWDGRDSAGSRVAPGLYILEILVEGDVGDERAQEIISVVY